jgi:hypothetical protein
MFGVLKTMFGPRREEVAAWVGICTVRTFVTCTFYQVLLLGSSNREADARDM